VSSLSLHKRLLSLVNTHRTAFLIAAGLGSGASLLAISQARLFSDIVNRAFLSGSTSQALAPKFALFLGILLVRGLLTYGSESASSTLAAAIKHRQRQELFTHLLRLGPGYTWQQATGDLANLLSEGIESLEAYFSQYLPQIIQAVLVPTAILFFVIQVDLLSGLILLLTAPLIPIFMVLISSLGEALTRKQWLSLSRMSAYFLDVLQGLPTLRALGVSKDQAQVIAQVSNRYREITMRVLRVTFLSALVLELVATLSTAIIAVEVGLRLLYGKLPFEAAFFILVLAPEFYLPLRLLGTRYHAAMSGTAAARQIFAVLDSPLHTPAPVAHSAPGLNTRPPEICFHNLNFSYQPEQPALRDVSFTIPRGKITALVGPSGAGKSTLVNLLLRFFEATPGSITVDGQEISTLPPAAWRQQVGWVPQKPYLFNDTIEANLRLAYPSASMEEIKNAARLAQAEEFILQLPRGYQTIIGERGQKLSTGQAQRIALARAFLKPASFILLDEPSSSLDSQTEQAIQESLQSLAVGRTVLVIAHRFSTVYQADHIIVLKDGQVVEQGKHEVLIKQAGTYAQMVRACSQNQAPVYSNDSGIEERDINRRFKPGSRLPNNDRLEETGRINPITTLWTLLRLLWPFKGWVLLSMILGFAAVGSSVGLMSTSAYILSAAALQPSISTLQVAIVGVRFFGITRGIFRYLERLVSHQVTFRLLTNLRAWFYQALEPLAPARLLFYRGGDLLNRITGDIAALESFYVRSAAPPGTALLVFLLINGIMLHFNPLFAGLTALTISLAGIGLPLLMNHLGQQPGRKIAENRLRLSVLMVDSVQGLPDILVFDDQERFIKTLQAQSNVLTSTQEQQGRLQALQTSLMFLLTHLCVWGTLLLGVRFASAGQIDPLYLGTIALAVLTSFEAIQPLPLAAQHLSNQLTAGSRLLEILQSTPATCDFPPLLPLPSSFALEVHGLRFSYPGQTELALDGIELSLPVGAHVAVVGPSGSGKTTLVNLLLRFWEYQDGSICLNGHDLRCYDQTLLRRTLSLVSQQTFLFNATLQDNLLIACPTASFEEIQVALERARLLPLIANLPQGVDTWIGEGGVRLSAGERQRLAMARAFLRQSPLIIFDEATAHLDAITEQEILAEIKRLRPDHTLLTITHRLVGLEGADEILVFDHGHLSQRGTHEHLLTAGGLYRKMWDLQNQMLTDAAI
jgi:ATP-binding cassette subfamily C protein CydCD